MLKLLLLRSHISQLFSNYIKLLAVFRSFCFDTHTSGIIVLFCVGLWVLTKVFQYFIFEDRSLSGYLSTCALFAEWSGGASGQVFPTDIFPLCYFKGFLPFHLDHHNHFKQFTQHSSIGNLVPWHSSALLSPHRTLFSIPQSYSAP